MEDSIRPCTMMCPQHLKKKKVKIAVVDSGINHWHSHIKRIEGGVGIGMNREGEIVFREDFRDYIGHGTACAAVIRDKVPEAELYSVKVFHKVLSTHSMVLIKAVEWSTQENMDVINLSVGTTNKEYIPLLQNICNYATQKGVLVVASGNRQRESYPAIFQNVIGVSMDDICKEDSIIYLGGPAAINFLACGYPCKLQGITPDQNFKGDSFAAARVTGLVASILERDPLADFNRIMEKLIKLSHKAYHLASG